MPIPTPLADRETLQRCLERICSDLFGDHANVAAVYQRSSERSTCYASEVVTVQLRTGCELKVFLKNFGWHLKPRDEVRPRAKREMRVYRDLLAPADLGTARYYGSFWEEAQDQFWLLLEFVEGQPVRYCDFAYWMEAAAWLGRMQGYFAQDVNRLNACEFLLRHDAEFFRSKAELARCAVAQISAALAARLEHSLCCYEKIIDLMTGPPLTLLHAGYRPKNIMVATQPLRSPRICPIDWEMAAVGMCVFDFAALSDGFEPPELNRLFEAYREGAGRYQFALPEPAEIRHLVQCFRLHRTIIRLGGAVIKQYDAEKVAGIVEDAEKLSQLLAW